jgi:hypothetical protein
LARRFVTGVLWIVFSSLLYLCEKDDTGNVINHLSQAERFKDIPHALPYVKPDPELPLHSYYVIRYHTNL